MRRWPACRGLNAPGKMIFGGRPVGWMHTLSTLPSSRSCHDGGAGVRDSSTCSPSSRSSFSRRRTPQASATTFNTSRPASRSSSARLRRSFCSCSRQAAVRAAVCRATWMRWGPRFGRSVARLAVQATPAGMALSRFRVSEMTVLRPVLPQKSRHRHCPGRWRRNRTRRACRPEQATMAGAE